jgi:hypothetical protein
MEAAAFVDTQVAPFAHKIGVAALDRLVEEAMARFMPDLAEENAIRAAVPRWDRLERQPGTVVPAPSSVEDSRHLALHHARSRVVSLDQPARLPVPA